MQYAEKLKDPRWQRKRLEILERDNFTCRYCGDKERELHVHHIQYSGEPWQADSEDLITTCKHCHLLISTFKWINPNEIIGICKMIQDPLLFFVLKGKDLVAFFLYDQQDLSWNSISLDNNTFDLISKFINKQPG